MSKRYATIIASTEEPQGHQDGQKLLEELRQEAEVDAQRRQEEPEGEPDGEEQDAEGQAERDRMEAYETARAMRGRRSEPEDAELAAVLRRRSRTVHHYR